MPKSQKPFVVTRRKDSKTFQFSLNPPCGLPERVCRDWRWASFQKFPPELVQYASPKNKASADAGVFMLIQFLKEKQNPDDTKRTPTKDISVGEWLEKFTSLETSPRAALLAAENRPYSTKIIATYELDYRLHIKSNPITSLMMSEVEEQDVLEFTNRMAQKKIGWEGKRMAMAGSRTFEMIVKFVRMAFVEYQRTHHRWLNPFQGIKAPKATRKPDACALSEDEVAMLFSSGVLQDTMELAVCAIMFLSGLRRAEIFALQHDSIDWHTPKIRVKQAWQNFDRKTRVLGPPKGKRERDAPFDPVLQAAIKKLWEENGRHKFVFSYADGTTPGPSWTEGRFKKWMQKAGIETNGRKIVPHSARHALASILEERGISLRYIQDLLGHSDLKTTKIYLHSTDRTIREIGKHIASAIEEKTTGEKPKADNILKFA